MPLVTYYALPVLCATPFPYQKNAFAFATHKESTAPSLVQCDFYFLVFFAVDFFAGKKLPKKTLKNFMMP